MGAMLFGPPKRLKSPARGCYRCAENTLRFASWAGYSENMIGMTATHFGPQELEILLWNGCCGPAFAPSHCINLRKGGPDIARGERIVAPQKPPPDKGSVYIPGQREYAC